MALGLCRSQSRRLIPYPDISTKAKAQKYIGLPIEKLKQEKEVFKKEVLPKWDAKAKERESKWK